MKASPILFNGPMVRALLDGSKTQTRRVVKQLDPTQGVVTKTTSGKPMGACWAYGGPVIDCPYGQPGDRLWVRETFQGPLFNEDQAPLRREDPSALQKPEHCVYAADGGAAPEFMTMDDELVCRWRPSIHMPRWASRILLEIVSVRVERLNDISDPDALAEGCSTKDMQHGDCLASVYARLWESINGAGSWAANPWVWVVEFRRIPA